MGFKALLAALLFLFFSFHVLSQPVPNREFRGVWVATVSNLDWPVKGASAENQKAALSAMFDRIKEANLNVVFFQIRTECDAFYSSSREPWSRFLTGTQGVSPGYDPLAFAIEEAHKRGLELHAWFNPYRVNASTSTSLTYAANHVTHTKPAWILSFSNGKKILNPGLPEVRQYITAVVSEVAANYAVDGIHFDDYFYPYPEGNFAGITNEDAGTFSLYGSGFTNIKDWRRNNVNETIRLVHEQLAAIKPGVRFGVSPFGIWKNGVPAGITGMDAYNTIYADPVTWLENQYVDYISPQLYWQIGGAQDYRTLLQWWAGKAYSSSRHLYAGHALYKTTFSEQEVPNQVNITRDNRSQNALGGVLYRAANLTSNTNNIFSNLRNTTFKTPAAPPSMAWKGGHKPAAPGSLTVTLDEATGAHNITWQRNPANTDSFKRYILYNLASPVNNTSDIPDGAVRALTVSESFTINAGEVSLQGAYWAVTELSPDNVESDLSQAATIGGVTAIARKTEKHQLKVYPNPATNRFLVDFELKKNAEVRAELVSLDGKVRTRILRKRFNAGAHTISVERGKLAPGMYLFVLTIDRTRTTKRVLLI
ncbi:family 10 glycosylhydrolase [Pontibacter locisalis]|uniref:Family 10 glycosylhydrolase n=1 Tax=Pontibacter locisalis TaxID=1719035 RepID=A0ABW5IJN0_9BACT